MRKERGSCGRPPEIAPAFFTSLLLHMISFNGFFVPLFMSIFDHHTHVEKLCGKMLVSEGHRIKYCNMLERTTDIKVDYCLSNGFISWWPWYAFESDRKSLGKYAFESDHGIWLKENHATALRGDCDTCRKLLQIFLAISFTLCVTAKPSIKPYFSAFIGNLGPTKFKFSLFLSLYKCQPWLLVGTLGW